jgi:hypothetical protein
MKIKTLAKFSIGESIDGVQDDSFEWSEFIFKIDALDVYNKGTDGYTTIELRSGTRQTIAIKWNAFEELMGKDYKTVIDAEALYEFNEKEN